MKTPTHTSCIFQTLTHQASLNFILNSGKNILTSALKTIKTSNNIYKPDGKEVSVLGSVYKSGWRCVEKFCDADFYNRLILKIKWTKGAVSEGKA